MKPTYKIFVTIDGRTIVVGGLTWRQACLALAGYGAKVQAPIYAVVTPAAAGEPT